MNILNYFLILPGILFLHFSRAEEADVMNLWPSEVFSEEDRVEGAKWRLSGIERFQNRLYEFEALEEPTLEQALEFLGPGLRRLNELPADKYLDSEEFLIAAARKHLRQYPGHAEYLINQFLSIKEDIVKRGTEEANTLGIVSDLESARRYAQYDLQAIASPEVVTEMAKMIDDKFEYTPGAKIGGIPPNSWIAGDILNKIIANPPQSKMSLIAWREWRDRVKAGELTFKLVGDPYDLEYNFDGPVEPKKAPLSASAGHPQGSAAGQEEHKGTRSENAEEHEASVRNLWFVLAGGLLAVAVAVLLIQEKRKSRNLGKKSGND